jgi:CD36 family
MKTKGLHIAFWTLLSLGVILIFAGIAVPLFMDRALSEGLLNLWLQPSGYDSWGEIPGKNNFKIVRSYKLFNITNPDQINSGNVGKFVELPPATFQETSQYINWTYQNASGASFGQSNPQDYLAFGTIAGLIPLPNNGTEVPFTKDITSVNFVTYITFYSLTHAPLPLYIIPALYDIVTAFENDFYYLILAYTSWARYFNDTSFTTSYLSSVGFGNYNNTIIKDPVYGWGDWKTLKPWIISLLSYNQTKLSNSFEDIDTYFQIDGLDRLISNSSLLYKVVESIQADMLARYGTNNKTQLWMLQWAQGTVTTNLPLDLGPVRPVLACPFSSVCALNSTYSTVIPEIYFFQLNHTYSPQNYSIYTEDLLEVQYEYPRTSTKSLLVLNNLVALLTATSQNIAQVCAQFGFTSAYLVSNLAYYLGSIVSLPVPQYNVSFDGYSLFLSKMTSKALNTGISKLRNDAYWVVPTLYVFSNFTSRNETCDKWAAKVVANTSFCNAAGWTAWGNLEIWVKAAFKGNTSEEYNLLSSLVGNDTGLQELLYDSADSFNTYANDSLKNTSLFYGCSKVFCNHLELLYQQWSISNITLNLPEVLKWIVGPSKTMSSWVTGYLSPIEWGYYPDLSPGDSALAGLFLTYDSFLNPNVIKIFYNSYFNQNYTKIKQIFNLTEARAQFVYDYFIYIIPGLEFFSTRKVSNWLNGYFDPFLSFVGSSSIYEGGIPTLQPYGAVLPGPSDIELPQSVKCTGRRDTSVTGAYYKYLGSSTLKSYGSAYDESFNPPTSYKYFDAWPQEINVTGSDGSSFGTQRLKTDVISAFIAPLLRTVTLNYVEDTSYYGLNLFHFEPTPGILNTSADSIYAQYPNGYDGFMNLSQQFGAPVFVSFPHCYLCSEEAQGMLEYYEYNTSNRIYPTHDDTSFTDVEPLSGGSIKVVLQFELRIGFYNDYFFKNFFANLSKTVSQKGFSLPIYTLIRNSALTESQVNTLFGGLIDIQKYRKIIFYTAILSGSGFIIFSLLVKMFIYRIDKYGTWKSRNSNAKKYMTLIDVKAD